MSYSPTLGRWISQDPLTYVDGMNLYQLSQSSPVTFVDPFGLDRYITSNATHRGIAVDVWGVRNGKWVVTGVREYSFHFDVGFWGIMGLMFGGPGQVTTYKYMRNSVEKTITSDHKADEYLRTQLDMAAANPETYSIWMHNCWDFVSEHINDGLPEEVEPPFRGYYDGPYNL